MKKFISVLMSLLLLISLALPASAAAVETEILDVTIAPDGRSMQLLLRSSQTANMNADNYSVVLDSIQLPVTSVTPYSVSGRGTSWVIIVDRQFNKEGNLSRTLSGFVTNLVGENDNVAIVFAGETLSSLSTPEDALARIDDIPGRDSSITTFYQTIASSVGYLRGSGDVLDRAVMIIVSPGTNTSGGSASLSTAVKVIDASDVIVHTYALHYGDSDQKKLLDYGRLSGNGGFSYEAQLDRMPVNDAVDKAVNFEQQHFLLNVSLDGFTNEVNGTLYLTANQKTQVNELTAEQVALINSTRGNAQSTFVEEGTYTIGNMQIAAMKEACVLLKWLDADAVNVTIPAAINGLSVRGVSPDAFAGLASLEEVTIPEGVQSIGANAFANCPKLSKVVLPASLTSIDDSAFSDSNPTLNVMDGSYAHTFAKEKGLACNAQMADSEFTYRDFTVKSENNQLTIIGWENDVDSIALIPAIIDGRPVVGVGEKAFAGKINLQQVTISEGVQSIGAEAFANCLGLREITLPESLTSIDPSAFSGCTSLTLVVKPDSAAHTFAKTNNLSCRLAGDVIYGDLTLYAVDGGLAIRSWNNTTSSLVIVPARVNGQQVMSIGPDAFAGKTGLKTVIIEEGVRTIEANAFAGCSGLEEVTLPASLSRIDSTAFTGCSDATFVVPQNSEARDFCVGKGYKIKGEFTLPEWAPYAAAGVGALLLIIVLALLLTRRKPLRSMEYNVDDLKPTALPGGAAANDQGGFHISGTEIEEQPPRLRVTLTQVNGVQGEHFDQDMTEELVIGRDPGIGGLQLPEREAFSRISRVHVRLFYENGLMYVQNESRNGTTVNGSRLGETACVLHERDRITIGRVDFIVTWHRI